MSSGKFRVGDRVVVISDEYPITRLGWTGEVVNSPDDYWADESDCLVFFSQLNNSYVVKEEDLELEDVYRSPLYKALR